MQQNDTTTTADVLLDLTIPGQPCGQPRARARLAMVPDRRGRVRPVPVMHRARSGPSARWEDAASWGFREAWAGRSPLDEPLVLEVTALFARPKRLLWKQRPTPRQPQWGRPDADNVLKAVADALQRAGVLRDDGIISCVTVWKLYAAGDEGPGVRVVLSRIE